MRDSDSDGEVLERLEGGGQPPAVALAGAIALGATLAGVFDHGFHDGQSGPQARSHNLYRHPPELLRGWCPGVRPEPLRARIHAGERLVAAERDDRLEDARRDRAAADGDAHRLEDLLGLDPSRSTTAQRGLGGLDVERLGPGERVAGGARASSAPSFITLSHAFGSVSWGSTRNAGQRPELGQRLHLLLGHRDGRLEVVSRPSSGSSRAASVGGRSSRR